MLLRVQFTGTLAATLDLSLVDVIFHYINDPGR